MTYNCRDRRHQIMDPDQLMIDRTAGDGSRPAHKKGDAMAPFEDLCLLATQPTFGECPFRGGANDPLSDVKITSVFSANPVLSQRIRDLPDNVVDLMHKVSIRAIG